MKVIGLIPQTSSVLIAALESDRSSVALRYRDEWRLAGTDRPRWYGELRDRLIERIRSVGPDWVCVSPLEPMALRAGRARVSWFQTAEVRGVLAEAACAAGIRVEFRTQGAVTRSMSPAPPKGSGEKRKSAAAFVSDDEFWSSTIGDDFPKKYREAALLAISRMRFNGQ